MTIRCSAVTEQLVLSQLQFGFGGIAQFTLLDEQYGVLKIIVYRIGTPNTGTEEYILLLRNSTDPLK